MKSDTSARRWFISGMSSVAAVWALGSNTRAQAPTSGFQPTRHQQDSWLNGLPGKHRTFIDTATPPAAGAGLLYANNLYVANKSGYALTEADLAIVVCLRHFATVFAYNNTIWGKYGKAMSDFVEFTDPKTKQAPSTNLLNSPDHGTTLPNFGNTIDSVVKRGTHFAVCDMATRFISGHVASVVGGNGEVLYKEFASNLIPNSHLAAAGVVAVNRAQEYGYTLLTAL
jgi:hypothetical protein